MYKVIPYSYFIHKAEHGKALNPYEKRRIAVKLMEMKVSGTQISKLIQVPQDKMERFVGDRLINTLTGQKNDASGNAEMAREIGSVLKTGLKHIAGHSIDPNALKDIQMEQEQFFGAPQRSLFLNVVKILENGLLDTEDKKVMVSILKLKKLLKKY